MLTLLCSKFVIASLGQDLKAAHFPLLGLSFQQAFFFLLILTVTWKPG